MIIPAKKLFDLPVVTKSGLKLGRVVNILVETDSQSILQYEVRRALFISSKTLLIHRGQVLSLNADQMIVEDSVLTEKTVAGKPALAARAAADAAPNLMKHLTNDSA